jgi:hypothetical protein
MICCKAEDLRSSSLFFLHYWQFNEIKLNGSASKLAFFRGKHIKKEQMRERLMAGEIK